jgi:hypothetical protein
VVEPKREVCSGALRRRWAVCAESYLQCGNQNREMTWTEHPFSIRHHAAIAGRVSSSAKPTVGLLPTWPSAADVSRPQRGRRALVARVIDHGVTAGNRWSGRGDGHAATWSARSCPRILCRSPSAGRFGLSPASRLWRGAARQYDLGFAGACPSPFLQNRCGCATGYSAPGPLKLSYSQASSPLHWA